MPSRLSFVATSVRFGVLALPVVDDVELPQLLGRYEGGLGKTEGRIAARLLQGWALPPEPPPIARTIDAKPLAKVRRGPAGASDRKFRRWGFVPGSGSREPSYVVLPGGDEPRVEAWHLDDFRDRDGIPVAGDEDGIGAGSIDVLVTQLRDQVVWAVEDYEFTFPRRRYDTAIRGLLTLLGETPRLIGE